MAFKGGPLTSKVVCLYNPFSPRWQGNMIKQNECMHKSNYKASKENASKLTKGWLSFEEEKP